MIINPTENNLTIACGCKPAAASPDIDVGSVFLIMDKFNRTPDISGG
jgi:hypothetical protein